MKRITKKEAAKIGGIHEKTLEHFIRENRNGINDRTGYEKNKLNGRITFDEDLFRAFMADMTGNDDLRVRSADQEPDAIDAEITDLVKRSDPQPLDLVQAQAKRGPVDAVQALLLPYKSFLTINEAHALTGLPKWYLMKKRIKAHGRNYIRATDIKTIAEIFPRYKRRPRNEKVSG